MLLLTTCCIITATYIAYKRGYITEIIKQMYIPSSLSKLNRYTYQLSYYHQGNQYHILIPIKRGPRKVIRITNEEQVDVTDEIRSYLGPNEDFHGFKANPTLLKHQKLSFHTTDGEVLHFELDDTILL